MRFMIRAPFRLAALAFAVGRARLLANPEFSLAERASWQTKTATVLLAALGIRVKIIGNFPQSGMVVCNHLGYLDVLAIASCGPVVFVSKAEVRKWPVVGPLLAAAGTILAERGSPMSAAKTSAQIASALAKNVPVVLFPEGTSTDGAHVLPFKPALFQPAVELKCPITPAGIGYHAKQGNVKNDVCYRGDHTFFPHLFRLASARGVTANLTFGEAIGQIGDRKNAAKIFHAEVVRLRR